MSIFEQLKDVKLNKARECDRQLYHMAQHIDNAMTEMAFAANIATAIIKNQSTSKRKDDKK